MSDTEASLILLGIYFLVLMAAAYAHDVRNFFE